MDYNRVLTIPVQLTDTVSSVKVKIDQMMGPGVVPEDVVDTLNYLGTTLACVNTLAFYGISDSSYLYMGRSLLNPGHPLYVPQSAPQPVAQPVAHQQHYYTQQYYQPQQFYQQQQQSFQHTPSYFYTQPQYY